MLLLVASCMQGVGGRWSQSTNGRWKQRYIGLKAAERRLQFIKLILRDRDRYNHVSNCDDKEERHEQLEGLGEQWVQGPSRSDRGRRKGVAVAAIGVPRRLNSSAGVVWTNDVSSVRHTRARCKLTELLCFPNDTGRRCVLVVDPSGNPEAVWNAIGHGLAVCLDVQFVRSNVIATVRGACHLPLEQAPALGLYKHQEVSQACRWRRYVLGMTRLCSLPRSTSHNWRLLEVLPHTIAFPPWMNRTGVGC